MRQFQKEIEELKKKLVDEGGEGGDSEESEEELVDGKMRRKKRLLMICLILQFEVHSSSVQVRLKIPQLNKYKPNAAFQLLCSSLYKHVCEVR